MISQTAEYALRAVVFLTEKQNQPQTIVQIAAATQTPPGYLAKVLQTLARAGIVAGQRGLGGGFTLSRPAEAVNALEVVEAVEPIRRIRSCPLGKPEHAAALCPLHQSLDDAAALIEERLRRASVADLAARPSFAPLPIS